MSAITAGNIIDKVEIIIQDLTNIRWTESELLGWLNDGQREIVKLKPETSITSLDSYTLSVGTKQSLPDGTGDDPAGIVLIDVPRNVASTSAKGVIRLVPRRVLDEQIGGWHADDGSVDIKHFCYDPRDPKHFYVYPPALATAEVELIYSSAPTDCASSASTISVDDVYANDLLNFVVYRAYLKDADYTANDTRATTQYNAFLKGLSLKEKAESASEPSRGMPPAGNPQPRG